MHGRSARGAQHLGTVPVVTDEQFSTLWNRACQWDSPAIKTHRGDEALHVVLTFHGTVQNGGLLHAVETHGDDPGDYPLPRVLQAYRFLGLQDVASTIEQARREYESYRATADETSGEVLEERIDASYLLDYDALEAAVRATLQASPRSFAPLS